MATSTDSEDVGDGVTEIGKGLRSISLAAVDELEVLKK